MNIVLGIITAVIAAATSSEIVVRGTKLQTRLTAVMIVWAAVYMGLMVWVAHVLPPAVMSVTLVWAGAFFLWFGLRSHVESSILLRMLVLLQSSRQTEAELVRTYAGRFGEAARIEELCRGGYLTRSGDRLEATAKGHFVLWLIHKLR